MAGGDGRHLRVADGSDYRVFTYASDMEGSGFRPTGMSYGGVCETFPLPS